MNTTYALLLVTMAITITLTHGQPRGRGKGLLEKFQVLYPEYMRITQPPPESPHIPKKRRVRGDRLLEKFVVDAGVELQTTPTTTTTTTLSPEQIEEEKRKRQLIEDPKNFLQKLKNKFGIDNLNSEEDGSSTSSFDGEVKKMHEKLHEKLEGCNDNSECFNATCCFKADPTKRGQCIIQPHRLDQQCSDMCGCSGKHEEIDLECKIMELTKANEKSEVLKTMQCKQRELTEKEYMTLMLRKMKEGRRARVPRRPRTQRKSRVMFV
ncbi:uncharacterized protein [Clytia hemisphaerica]|uniref:Uncharacterized protein n=1 Tax=Clytia hemisphaerica TaxID=252671 RepID=A0A7M6DNG7_9CNID